MTSLQRLKLQELLYLGYLHLVSRHLMQQHSVQPTSGVRVFQYHQLMNHFLRLSRKAVGMGWILRPIIFLMLWRAQAILWMRTGLIRIVGLAILKHRGVVHHRHYPHHHRWHRHSQHQWHQRRQKQHHQHHHSKRSQWASMMMGCTGSSSVHKHIWIYHLPWHVWDHMTKKHRANPA